MTKKRIKNLTTLPQQLWLRSHSRKEDTWLSIKDLTFQRSLINCWSNRSEEKWPWWFVVAEVPLMMVVLRSIESGFLAFISRVLGQCYHQQWKQQQSSNEKQNETVLFSSLSHACYSSTKRSGTLSSPVGRLSSFNCFMGRTSTSRRMGAWLCTPSNWQESRSRRVYSVLRVCQWSANWRLQRNRA